MPPRGYSGKLADPEFRAERARKAARASWHGPGALVRVLNRLPELTPEQIEIVRRALPPAPAETDRWAGE